MNRRLALAITLLAAAACAPKRIPGTDIQDTSENRAVYKVVEDVVNAINKRDAGTVLANVSPDYFDDAGTPEPTDDLDRERLEKSMAADFGKVEGSKLAVTIRKIEVTEGATAFVEVFYDSYYRVQTPAGPVPRRDSDVHRMRLKKIEGAWKVAAGL